MDHLGNMQTFVRVAHAKSFTAAAAQLGLSKALVSRQIAALERRLGVRLLNRSTRYVTLTEEGKGYLTNCERLLNEMEVLEQSIAVDRAFARGAIKVHAPKSFGSMVLADAVTAFSEAQPDIRVSLMLGDFTFRPYDFVEYGFDIGIRISHIRDSALIARKIGKVESALCASPSYLRRHGAPESLSELRKRPCLVHLNLSPNDRIWRFDGPTGVESVQVSGPIYSNSALVLRRATLGGSGICILPEYCIHEELRNGSLVRIMPQYAVPTRPILVVRPRTTFMTEKVRVFVNFLANWFKARAVIWESARTIKRLT